MQNPIWKFLPASLAHEWAPVGIKIYSELFPLALSQAQWQPFTWNGLQFRNRLGLAGGADKNGDLLNEWQNLGAGFIEVGTVTPLPQRANPGKIVDRDWDKKNLWNKMGFPNDGANDLAVKLDLFSASVPVFVNIGKNRSTPNEHAIEDYEILARQFSSRADAIVVNVSSPNTTGLRDLQSVKQISQLCERVVRVTKPPVLVKLSPDEEPTQLQATVDAALSAGARGIILTNTTRSRPNGCKFSVEGGLSGSDLSEKSKQALQLIAPMIKSSSQRNITSPLLISVGGILTPQDVEQRLSLGADLVQIYAALVFHGPGFFKHVAQHFNANANGGKHVS